MSASGYQNKKEKIRPKSEIKIQSKSETKKLSRFAAKICEFFGNKLLYFLHSPDSLSWLSGLGDKNQWNMWDEKIKFCFWVRFRFVGNELTWKGSGFNRVVMLCVRKLLIHFVIHSYLEREKMKIEISWEIWKSLTKVSDSFGLQWTVTQPRRLRLDTTAMIEIYRRFYRLKQRQKLKLVQLCTAFV